MRQRFVSQCEVNFLHNCEIAECSIDNISLETDPRISLPCCNLRFIDIVGVHHQSLACHYRRRAE